MKYLGVIPARAGSKGIPGKNYKALNGKPLIQYTIEAALGSCLDAVVVSTDCQNIVQLAKELGVDVICRPPNLAQDDTPSRPVIEHALESMEEQFDAVVTLQPTSPLRNCAHIDAALAVFDNSEAADSLVSVTKVSHNMVPESIMVLRENHLENYISNSSPILRRQDKGCYFARNGAAIYITRESNIASYIFGGKVIPFEMDKITSLDIDDLEDWCLVESVVRGRES